MSYANPVTVFQFSNPYVRKPFKWTITTYLNNVQVEQTTYYTEQDMMTAFGQLQQQSIVNGGRDIDQITVLKYTLDCPSQGPDS